MATINSKKRDYIDSTKYLVEYLGSSSETKPTDSNLKVGSMFLEIDTGDIYFYNGTTWAKPGA